MPDESGLNSDFYLTDISPSDKPWDVHRNVTSIVESLYQGSDFQGYADRIHQCSQLLGFALKAQDSGELKLKLNQARFCRVRHCPVCQWRRSLVWRARFFTALPKVLEAYPKHRWVFLTLTVRNCPLKELKLTLQQMNKAWERLTKRKQFPAIGFVRATEITRGKAGDAHPHFHALLLVSSSYFGSQYMKQAEWRELWKSALRVDYLPVVNVKAVKAKPGHAPGQGLAIAVLETMKYGVKEDDLVADREWLLELTKQLHKTRAMSIGGVLREFLKEDEPTDFINTEEEILETPEETELNLWFGWREMVQRYAKAERR